ncbi:MAG: histidine phosphatase family protein [Cyanobacteria bacterium P01_A01_bin.123]
MGSLKLILLRHAQSIGNAQGRMEGQHSSPLSVQGQQQANELAIVLKHHWSPTHLYCSPLQRAQETLHHLLTSCNYSSFPALALSDSPLTPLLPCSPSPHPPIPLTLCNTLQEAHGGIFQNLTWAEACDRYPEICHRLEHSPDWQPVPQAETPAAVRQRSRQFLHRILQTHRNGDRLWIVTHSWLLQHLISEILGSDRTWGIAIAPTAWFEFSLDRDRWGQSGPNQYNGELWKIHRFNDTSHRHT